MKYELVIKADTNDGDYVTETIAVNDIEIFLSKFGSLINAISNYNGYNWENGDIGTNEGKYPEFSDKLLEEFEAYLPCGEHGIHTIESIVYYPLPEKITLL